MTHILRPLAGAMLISTSVAAQLPSATSYPIGMGPTTSKPASNSPTLSSSPQPKVMAQPRSKLVDGFTLAFVDADVRRVVDAVFGAMLGVDYTIDPKIQGNITLRTAKPVTRDALVPLLETALRSVDAVILSEDGSYRIVPRSEARSRAVPLDGAEGGSSRAGYSTEMVQLKYASTTEMARLLGQFLGKDVVAGTEPSSNAVLITGSADERRSARALIAKFDVDTLANMTYSLHRLENVDPESLLGELEKIFKPPYDVIGSRVRVIPLPRMKSVLVVASSRDDLNRIEPWIQRLDVGASGKRRLYSYAVQNGRARDIARALQLVLGSQVSVAASSGSLGSQSMADRSLLSNSGGTSGGISSPTSMSSGPIAAAGREPSDVIGAETPLPGSGTLPASPSGGEGPRIVPAEDTNTLLIYANGEEYELVRSALEKIDVAVSQVLIEATLAEVTLTKDFNAGVDWSVLSGNSTFKNNNTSSPTPTAIFPGFSYGYLGATAQVVLNTLQSKTNVKVLSAPKLLVLNNQTATLQVGDQVPIVTQQSQSVAAAGAPLVNSIELHDTGVILKVTPRVNDSGVVQLDIAQEVSDVTPTTTSGINSPTIQQRRLATTVTTRSGQMVALGGLIRTNSTRQKSGFPILSQIPLIGAAFGTQTNRTDQTELIILLTPTVIRNPADATKAVDELLDRMDSVRPLVTLSNRKSVAPPPPPHP